MNNHELIQNLTTDLKPVKRFKINKLHLLICLSSGLFSMLAGVALVGIRADLLNVLKIPTFYIETFLLITLAFFSTATSLQLTVPRFSKSRSWPLVIVTLAAWILFAAYQLLAEPTLLLDNGTRCLTQIILGAVIPAGFIFFIALEGATLDRAKLGATVLIAGSAYGALMAEFSCAICNPLHFIIWHVVPVIGLSLFGLWVGRLLLKKI